MFRVCLCGEQNVQGDIMRAQAWDMKEWSVSVLYLS